ncbi:MAG: helix-turn-helix transcriptional regulator [Chitinophagales bacterium]
MKPLFSKNLSFLRKRKQLSQSALANALNYTRSNIASYEFGGSEPNIKRLQEISRFFDVSLDALLGSNIEKAMFDNRLKEKPIKDHEEIPEHWEKSIREFQSDCAEIESIQQGMKQFLQFKKKKWNNPDPEMSALIQEYEKLIDLMDFLLEKSNALVKNKKGS